MIDGDPHFMGSSRYTRKLAKGSESKVYFVRLIAWIENGDTVEFGLTYFEEGNDPNLQMDRSRRFSKRFGTADSLGDIFEGLVTEPVEALIKSHHRFDGATFYSSRFILPTTVDSEDRGDILLQGVRGRQLSEKDGNSEFDFILESGTSDDDDLYFALWTSAAIDLTTRSLQAAARHSRQIASGFIAPIV